MSTPHAIEDCYGSRLHCAWHNVDEPETDLSRGGYERLALGSKVPGGGAMVLLGLTCFNDLQAGTTDEPGTAEMTDWALLTERDQGAACPVPASATLLRDKWDEHAKEWIAWVRSPLQLDSYERFHRKRFLDLVPEPVGVTLDIACGEGRVARDLQAYGHTVLGVDWSQSMCEAAASHPDRRPDKSAILVGDATRLPIADASVGCVVAFMSLHDIDNLQGAIAEIARVLQDGKKLALAIVHPMYSGGKFDQSCESQKDFIINDSYFQAKLRVSRDSQGGLTMTFYREHRPLQTYVKVLLDAGFAIEQLYEVTEEDEGNARHRVPMFLDILATRQPRKDQPIPLPESKTASRWKRVTTNRRIRRLENRHFGAWRSKRR